METIRALLAVRGRTVDSPGGFQEKFYPDDDERTAHPAGTGLGPGERELGSVFAFMGAANLYVAFNYSTETWVDFKLFGFMGFMLVFVVLQGLMLGKYMVTDEDKEA